MLLITRIILLITGITWNDSLEYSIVPIIALKISIKLGMIRNHISLANKAKTKNDQSL